MHTLALWNRIIFGKLSQIVKQIFLNHFSVPVKYSFIRNSVLSNSHCNRIIALKRIGPTLYFMYYILKFPKVIVYSLMFIVTNYLISLYRVHMLLFQEVRGHGDTIRGPRKINQDSRNEKPFVNMLFPFFQYVNQDYV